MHARAMELDREGLYDEADQLRDEIRRVQYVRCDGGKDEKFGLQI